MKYRVGETVEFTIRMQHAAEAAITAPSDRRWGWTYLVTEAMLKELGCAACCVHDYLEFCTNQYGVTMEWPPGVKDQVLKFAHRYSMNDIALPLKVRATIVRVEEFKSK